MTAPEPWLGERVVKLGGQRVVKLGPGATAAEVAEAEALARVIEHSGRQIRQSAGVPPNAIMVPEEAEPAGLIQPDGTWRYPVSHWPGGLREAKAAAREAERDARPRHPVYGPPPVTGTGRRPRIIPPQPLPVAPLTHRTAPREPLAGRQPREDRGPRHLAPRNCPELLARCPICGMEDLPSLLPEALAEWEGWPVHADCAEWIRGSDPAAVVLSAPDGAAVRILHLAARYKYTLTMAAIVLGLTAALAVKDPVWCWLPAVWAAFSLYAARKRAQR